MTDKELLELAAKAAGIACDENGPYVERQKWQQWFGEQGTFETVRDNWSPLTDDGDALRLAVKLGLVPASNRVQGQSIVYINDFPYPRCFPAGVPHNGCEYAATRRAIVQGAAEIGKALP